MLFSMTFLPTAAFAHGTPDNNLLAHHAKLFVFVQGVDTSLSASHARDGIISAYETFGVPNGPYPVLKALYPEASFLVFSYNGDDGQGIPTAYDCQDTVADKAIGYAPSNVLKTYAMRLNTQLEHYLAHKPATDVYLISHSLGGIVVFSYLAYLKSLNALDSAIPGTTSHIKGVITLDSPIGGIAGGLTYAQVILTAFANAGYPCDFVQQNHITLSTAEQVISVYQHARAPIGGTNSIMSVLFGQGISNQRLAEEAAKGGIHVMTVGNERDFLFGPQACDQPFDDFLSSQWIGDKGNRSGVYGRTFVGGDSICTTLDENHSLVLTDAGVHEAIEQFVSWRAVTALSPAQL